MKFPSLPRASALAAILMIPASVALADSYSSAVLGSNPLLYYRFQETGTTATNSGSASINGTANNANILGTAFGPLSIDGYAGFQDNNLAASLTGTQWITLGTQNQLFSGLSGSAAVTVESWINLSSVPSSGQYTILNIPSGSGGPTALGFNVIAGGDIQFQGRNIYNGAIQQYTFDTNFSPNAWHYLAGVYDYAGNSYSLYVDGLLIATVPVTFTGNFTLNDTTGNAQVGIGDYKHGANPANAYFQGLVDEVAVYNYGLSASEIGAHYQAALVPEPSAFLLVGTAVGGLLLVRRRRK